MTESFDTRLKQSLSPIKPLARCACGHAYEDHKAQSPHRCGDCVCTSFVRPRSGVFYPRANRTKVTLERVEQAALMASARFIPIVEVRTCTMIVRRTGKVCGRVLKKDREKYCGFHS